MWCKSVVQFWVGLLGIAGLTACASVVSPSTTDVQIRTNPDAAQCDLTGFEDFSASVHTPASVAIPTNASPVTVVCRAPGFRPTSYTLTASTQDGWVWGNSAFVFATGGVAILGALVDEGRSAGKSYADQVQYDLNPDQPRQVRVRSRDGNVQMDLQAR